METINKIFKVNKSNNLIDMYNKEDNTHQYLEYYKFESLIVLHFGFDKAQKLLTYLNENKTLIIDIENKKALLVKDKSPNYNNVFKDYMSNNNVLKAYRKDIVNDIPSFLQDLEDEKIGKILF